MSALQILQAKVKPISLEEIRAKREETFEFLLQKRILGYVKSVLISGSYNEKIRFAFTLRWKVVEWNANSAHEFAQYARNRLHTLLPDFKVTTQVFVKTSCFWRLEEYSIEFCIQRRDSSPAHSDTSEKDVLLNKND